MYSNENCHVKHPVICSYSTVNTLSCIIYCYMYFYCNVATHCILLYIHIIDIFSYNLLYTVAYIHMVTLSSILAWHLFL